MTNEQWPPRGQGDGGQRAIVCHSQFRSPWLGVQFPGSSLKLVTRLPDTSRGRAASDSIREELSLSWLRAWDRDESYNTCWLSRIVQFTGEVSMISHRSGLTSM